MAIQDKHKVSIFSILLKKEKNKLLHLGTGFLIGLNGLFFTCGHTFRKIESELKINKFKNLYVGFPSSEAVIYEISSLKYLSYPIYEQFGPVYFDTCIGAINHVNSDFVIFNRKRPKNGEVLHAIGLVNTTDTRLHPFENGIADLSGISFIETSLIVSHQYPIISDLPKDYQIPRAEVNPRKFFNNCVELNKNLIKGASGCPIFDQIGLVSGVFVAGSEINNTSAMILGKYCTKTIKYRTNYNYNMYQDLAPRRNFTISLQSSPKQLPASKLASKPH